MLYIDVSSYICAMSQPLDGELAGLELAMIDGRPQYLCGGGGVIFKGCRNGCHYAIKCFTVIDQNLISRYKSNQEYCDIHNISSIPKFNFISDAITVDQWGESYVVPLLIMEWIEGESLNRYICELCYTNRLDELRMFTERFLEFSRELILSEMVHSDIKGDNIITDGDTLHLIDIDALSIHGEHIQSDRLLSPWYSHPSSECYPHLRDHYPIAIIVASLLALERDSRLVDLYHNGENIIFDPCLLVAGCDPAMKMTEGIFADRHYSIKLKDYITSREVPTYSILPVINDIISSRCGMTSADDIIFPCSASLYDIVKRRGGGYGYVDSSGRVVIDAIYDDVKDFRESRAAVRLAGKWLYINLEGEMIGSGYYDMATAFSCSLAAVRVGALWGYINLDGEFAIEPTFHSAAPFKENLAVVSHGRGYYYINIKGERAIIGDFHWASSFSGGYATIESAGKELTIDKNGKVVDR